MQVDVPLHASPAAPKLQAARKMHPRHWERKHVVSWLETTHSGRFKHCAGKLPSQAAGKDICRWPTLRFRQLAGDDELGDLLFNAFKHAKLSANSKHAAAVQANTASAIARKAGAV